MKLIMENWNSYLKEEEIGSEMIQFLSENGVTLTEEQLQEVNWKALLKKYGTKAAVLAALAGGSGQAQAGDSFDDKWAAANAAFDAEFDTKGDAFDAKLKAGDDAFDKKLSMGADTQVSKLPVDVDGAKASLPQIAAELEAAGEDRYKRLNIFTKYGLNSQNTVGGENGRTTFVFNTKGGTAVQFTVPNSKAPPGLISR